MKENLLSKYWLTSTLICGLLTTSCVSMQAQDAPSSVWIEGENATAHNFSGSVAAVNADGSGASGGLYLCTLTDQKPTGDAVYYAEYRFKAPKAGSYKVWIGGSPQNTGWASPFSVKIDKGTPRSLKDIVWSGAVYGGNELGWIDSGPVELTGGEHTIRVEIPATRSIDKLFVGYLDAILLTTDQGFVPAGNHPKYSTQPSWEERSKGKTFAEVKRSLEEPLYRAGMAKQYEELGPKSVAEILAKLSKRPLQSAGPRGPHTFGVHGMEQPFVTADNDKEKTQRAYELLARVGVQSFRTAESCWHRLGDNFDNFKELDFQVENAQKYGIGHIFTVGYPAGKYALGGESLSAVKPEYEGMYRQYLQTILKRYKDKGVEYYELGNEVDAPHVWWKNATPQMYVNEMRWLKEEIQKTDPTIKTLGFAATYSRDTKLGGQDFVKQCFDLGIDKYTDAYSFHYSWPKQEWALTQFFREQITKAGSPDKPLLNSEESGWGKPADILKVFARDFFLLNLKHVDYFLAQDFFENGNLLHVGLFDRDWNPKVRLLPYALSVDAMKGRELVGIASPSPNIEAYVLRYAPDYKGNGTKYSVVLWQNDTANPEVNGPMPGTVYGKVKPVKVSGFKGVDSAYNWRLDKLNSRGKNSFEVGVEPIAVFTDQLPDWKLQTAQQWLDANSLSKNNAFAPLPAQ